jgi:hypothetical protein
MGARIWQSQKHLLYGLIVFCFSGVSMFLWKGLDLSYTSLTLPDLIRGVFGSHISLPAPILDLPKFPKKEKKKSSRKIPPPPQKSSLEKLAALSLIDRAFNPDQMLYESWLNITARELNNWTPTARGARLRSGMGQGKLAFNLLRANLEDLADHIGDENKQLKNAVESAKTVQKAESDWNLDSLLSGFKMRTGADLFRGEAYADFSNRETSFRFNLLDSGEMTLRSNAKITDDVHWGFQQTFGDQNIGAKSEATLRFRW